MISQNPDKKASYATRFGGLRPIGRGPVAGTCGTDALSSPGTSRCGLSSRHDRESDRCVCFTHAFASSESDEFPPLEWTIESIERLSMRSRNSVDASRWYVTICYALAVCGRRTGHDKQWRQRIAAGAIASSIREAEPVNTVGRIR